MKETDEFYLNYCAQFKRTFDSVAVEGVKENDQTIMENDDSSPRSSSAVHQKSNDETDDSAGGFTKLTKNYIASVIEKLSILPKHSKIYASVPKFQKCIILHRFVSYLLFYYDGKPQQVTEIKLDDQSRQANGVSGDCSPLKQILTYKNVQSLLLIH